MIEKENLNYICIDNYCNNNIIGVKKIDHTIIKNLCLNFWQTQQNNKERGGQSAPVQCAEDSEGTQGGQCKPFYGATKNGQ